VRRWSFLVVVGLFACDLGGSLYDTEGNRACDNRDIWYADGDGDGVGDATIAYVGCEQPEGWVESAGDCDDADVEVAADCDTGGDSGHSGTADSGDDSGGADSGDTAGSG
jgi:hypothetical protein